MKPITRVFLVGCPRSGTTLLQSLLSAHPQVASFPESHFFTTVISSQALLYQLGLASPRARTRFYQFVHEIGHSEMRRYLPGFPVFTRQYTRAFLAVLDTLTRQQQKSLWLEKTPRHLHYIDDISRLVPGAKFIHLIRNGADTVASLYEVVQAHPDTWKAFSPGDLDQCIQRWLTDAMITRQHCHKSNHILIRYEHLTEEPRLVLTKLCTFIGLPFSETMLTGYQKMAEQLVHQRETWKLAAREAIHNTNNTKFYRLFDADQRHYITSQISQVNMEELAQQASGW
jgi:hypothetical protein